LTGSGAAKKKKNARNVKDKGKKEIPVDTKKKKKARKKGGKDPD